jgi:hypothetical protein
MNQIKSPPPLNHHQNNTQKTLDQYFSGQPEQWKGVRMVLIDWLFNMDR